MNEHRRSSPENFSRKDRLYSTLPGGGVGRVTRSVTNLARSEECNDWSDDDAVALNGDWVSKQTVLMQRFLKIPTKILNFSLHILCVGDT